MLGSTFAGKVTTWYRPSGFECELIAPLFPKDPTEPTRGSSPPDAPSGNGLRILASKKAANPGARRVAKIPRNAADGLARNQHSGDERLASQEFA
jgi:hypothetical protein